MYDDKTAGFATMMDDDDDEEFDAATIKRRLQALEKEKKNKTASKSKKAVMRSHAAVEVRLHTCVLALLLLTSIPTSRCEKCQFSFVTMVNLHYVDLC